MQMNDVFQVASYRHPDWLVQHYLAWDGQEYGIWNWLLSAARSRQQRD
jgi:hypothetical protein